MIYFKGVSILIYGSSPFSLFKTINRCPLWIILFPNNMLLHIESLPDSKMISKPSKETLPKVPQPTYHLLLLLTFRLTSFFVCVWVLFYLLYWFSYLLQKDIDIKTFIKFILIKIFTTDYYQNSLSISKSILCYKYKSFFILKALIWVFFYIIDGNYYLF